MAMLKHLLCSKIPFPSKIVEGKSRPLTFQRCCCFGECNLCEDFRKSDACLLNCPTLFNPAKRYKWNAYALVKLDNGIEQKELQPTWGSLADFRNTFNESFLKYRKHYFTYKWLNLTRDNDLENLRPNELFIQADFSAQPTLDSQDKLNSVGHGVCVLIGIVVLHSPRQESYINKEGVRKYYTFYECDHIRVVSPSTGKQKDQDWFLHCRVLEYIIKHYQGKMPDLDTIILWTDGSPSQYKCRQNFYWLTTVFAMLNVTTIHRFAATAQFKGIHDKIGQVAKWAVQ
jgi:hypothetical protein